MGEAAAGGDRGVTLWQRHSLEKLPASFESERQRSYRRRLLDMDISSILLLTYGVLE